MSYPQVLMLCIVCFALTALSCYAGDDDVVYKCLDRKPTPREAVIRVRFVFSKTFTSILGGELMALFIGRDILKTKYAIALSDDQFVLLTVVCVGTFSLLIGVLQNGMRRLQGRPQRPLIDGVIWRHNLRLWIRGRET